MNIHKRLRIGKLHIGALGLVPDSEDYDASKHRIASIMVFSDDHPTPEWINDNIIYLGYNQVADATVMVLACGLECELETVSGAKKLIRVRKTGYVLTVDEVIRNKNTQTRFFIPLRDPRLDNEKE